MSSLITLLRTLEDAESGIIEASNEELKETLGDIRDKVDAVHEVHSRLQAEEKRLADHIKELTKRKSTVKKSIERLESYMLYCLDEADTTLLCGKNWDIKVSQRRSEAVKEFEVNEKVFLELGPVFVKREFSINKAHIKEAAKDNPDIKDKYIESRLNRSVKFSNHK